jgi:hypothetical protein
LNPYFFLEADEFFILLESGVWIQGALPLAVACGIQTLVITEV